MELQYTTKERGKSGEGKEGEKDGIELYYEGSGEKWKCTLYSLRVREKKRLATAVIR